MNLTCTIHESEDFTQDVEIEYELEQDYYHPSVFWVEHLKVRLPEGFVPEDLETDVLESIRLFENVKVVKMGCRIKIEYQTQQYENA